MVDCGTADPTELMSTSRKIVEIPVLLAFGRHENRDLVLQSQPVAF